MKIQRGKVLWITWVWAAVIFLQPPASVAQEPELSLSLAAAAPIMSKNSHLAAIGQGLAALSLEYERFLQVAGVNAASRFRASNRYINAAGGYVVIDAVAAANPSDLKAELEALKIINAAGHGSYISGRLPISAIPMLAALKNLKFARPAYSMTLAGNAVSQGDRAMRADSARAQFSVDGTGITVGTLSDSYNCLGGANTDVASGELPAGIIVLDDAICPSGSDEGRAMMQLITDVAPGADQIFHTAFGGQANFAQGIIDLANAGADVIVDDVIYFAEPMFQDGIIAQAVDSAVANGVAYFSSAGNQSRQSYQAPFNPSGRQITIGGSPAGEAHDFNPGSGVDIFQHVTIPAGATLIISFQWDSPYFSVSGGSGSTNDIDIFIVNASQTSVVAGSASPNIGGDPEEILIFTNFAPFTANYNIMITNFNGHDPGLLKYVIFNTSISINQYDTASGTAYGHANAAGAEAVAAAFFGDTPEFETDPAEVEHFSSAGGVPILFDIAGNRKSSPEIREKPGITAPDGTNTTFFGDRIEDNDNFPNFFGTSAAAPHAAAVAALLLEADPSLLPAEVYAILEETALDMDDPSSPGFDSGFDFATGFGLIQAEDALASAVPPCVGDLNGDRIIDEDDISIFADAFGNPNCGEDCAADLDHDEDIDGDDLRILAGQLEDGCE